MDLLNESAAVNELAHIIVKGSAELFNSVKYIYSIADSSFYSVDIRDAFRMIFEGGADMLPSLGLSADKSVCAEMASDEYNKVLVLMAYSFAVRIPVLRGLRGASGPLTDSQLDKIYGAVMAMGAENYRNSVPESYEDMKALAKKGKELPPYSADWFKIYVLKNVPQLAELTNKNVFLFGFADLLFPLYWPHIEEKLFERLKALSADDFGGGMEI